MDDHSTANDVPRARTEREQIKTCVDVKDAIGIGNEVAHIAFVALVRDGEGVRLGERIIVGAGIRSRGRAIVAVVMNVDGMGSIHYDTVNSSNDTHGSVGVGPKLDHPVRRRARERENDSRRIVTRYDLHRLIHTFRCRVRRRDPDDPLTDPAPGAPGRLITVIEQRMDDNRTTNYRKDRRV